MTAAAIDVSNVRFILLLLAIRLSLTIIPARTGHCVSAGLAFQYHSLAIRKLKPERVAGMAATSAKAAKAFMKTCMAFPLGVFATGSIARPAQPVCWHPTAPRRGA